MMRLRVSLGLDKGDYDLTLGKYIIFEPYRFYIQENSRKEKCFGKKNEINVYTTRINQ
jgi:hypothetical protein